MEDLYIKGSGIAGNTFASGSKSQAVSGRKMNYQGFILSGSQVLRNNETQLIFQGRLSGGKRFHWTITTPKIVYFINHHEEWTPPDASRKETELRSLRGEAVDALYFRNTMEMANARSACAGRNILTYEADVNLVARFLMEHFIHGGVRFNSEPIEGKGNILYFTDPTVEPSDFKPVLKLLSIDIECSMKADLYSISLYGADMSNVLMVAPGNDRSKENNGYRACKNEREVLEGFFQIVHDYDPDALIGWNVVNFDLQWLSSKCESLRIALNIGTDGPAMILAPDQGRNQWIARIPGRSVLDGISMVRAAYLQPEDYSLSTVSHEVLGRTKLIEKTGREKAEEIDRLFREDKASLARYNLEDAKLVYEIFERLKLTDLALRRSQLTGLALDRVGGSVAAFDFLYLPRLHRRGFVADTNPRPPEDAEPAPGGLVLESTPGFYRNVGVFDFKSLYPSIIRTFKVDPLAANIVMNHLPEISDKEEPQGKIVKGPAGLGFAMDYSILPEIIEELWQERDNAKQNRDATLSQAVKIIMNSFYGVLGSPGCRFCDPRLAGTITRIGHWILKSSRKFIEGRGYKVIYGDTDSLFVHLGDEEQMPVKEAGAILAADLNRYLHDDLESRFDVESHLEIQFEKIFLRFFMPTVRGQEKGSKKRYAGLMHGEAGDHKLYFAGMESSRRDWTMLAKEFQADLFSLLFRVDNESTLMDELKELIRSRHSDLYAGKLDNKLMYVKGIHKPLEDYTKNVPPHVRAAKKLESLDSRVVHYVMTKAGPEPVQKRSGAPLDYSHYSEKQLAPVADMVLRFLDVDYSSITGQEKQLKLFVG
jgi:DNA polymerase II